MLILTSEPFSWKAFALFFRLSGTPLTENASRTNYNANMQTITEVITTNMHLLVCHLGIKDSMFLLALGATCRRPYLIIP